MKSARKEVKRRFFRAFVELEGTWAALMSVTNECVDVAAMPRFLYLAP
jgi:hypothetical protein